MGRQNRFPFIGERFFLWPGRLKTPILPANYQNEGFTNVELSGENGLIVRGNSFHYHIGGIQNAEELKKTILDNLSKTTNQTLGKDAHVDESTADELRRLKELLDDGILTQDEFDAKKELLLGLK